MTTTSACRRGAVFVAIAAIMAACGPKPEAEDPTGKAPPGSASPTPPWLGTYDDAQKAVLALPLEAKVDRRATPVYPTLSHFTFAGEGPVDVPDDLLEYANLISETLSASPLLYVFRNGPASLANLRALWGPEPERNPDPWQRVVVDSLGRPSLVAALPSDAVRPLLDKAATPGPESLPLLQQAAQKAPDVPGVHAMLADSALAANDLDVADGAARAALAIDPAFPHAFRVLAEVAMRRGDNTRAREAISRALALYPTYPRAWKVAEAIVGHELDRAAKIEQPFIEVTPAGAVIVVSCERPFCAGYAACKAAFRFEPVFRAAVLQEPDTQPYHLSATEEVVCLQAGLGAHAELHLQESPDAVPDPTAELLIQLAGESGLTAYAMFEVIGPHRPEWLRVAPRPVHEAIVQHIQLRVLGVPSGPTDIPIDSAGPITASLQPNSRPGR